MQYYDDSLQQRSTATYTSEGFSAYLSRVFFYMFLALGFTAIIGTLGSRSVAVQQFAISLLSAGPGGLVFFLLYFGLAMGFSAATARMNTPVAVLLFAVFAGLTGVTWSVLGLIFSVSAIWKAFLAAGVFFGVMALYGATTKRDLSKLGTILFIALISIIVVTFLNILFFRSGAMDLVISGIGVIVFSLYTAYDVAKLKQVYMSGLNDEILGSVAIMGAFDLYLDFINLFLYLLRFFGNSRD